MDGFAVRAADVPKSHSKNYLASQLVMSTGHPLDKLLWCADYFWAVPSLGEREATSRSRQDSHCPTGRMQSSGKASVLKERWPTVP